jgi:hypothetical protein
MSEGLVNDKTTQEESNRDDGQKGDKPQKRSISDILHSGGFHTKPTIENKKALHGSDMKEILEVIESSDTEQS